MHSPRFTIRSLMLTIMVVAILCRFAHWAYSQYSDPLTWVDSNQQREFPSAIPTGNGEGYCCVLMAPPSWLERQRAIEPELGLGPRTPSLPRLVSRHGTTCICADE